MATIEELREDLEFFTGDLNSAIAEDNREDSLKAIESLKYTLSEISNIIECWE